MYKRVVLCSLLGLAGIAQATMKSTDHATGKYVYDLHEKTQPKNNYTLALAPFAIDFSKNVPESLRDKFRNSLQAQITHMLEMRGYSVLASTLDKLNLEQKEKIFAVVDVSAFVDILEDTDMKLSKKHKEIEEDITDISAGFMRLKLIEPKSKNAFHMSSMELPSYKVKTHVLVSQQRTSSGGFMPVSRTTVVRDEKFESNIDQILAKIYVKSVQKLAQDLLAQTFKPYEHLVENFKKNSPAQK
ncbi:HpaA family protein [Helicobacter baculiformis]|uniref:Neuraminyllactose-binding hemagglutinin n=1 Tax=Helicobacter baculiformis TaxID=427351 RepID=A0ABV7ZM02_9HELI|nr:HpaA family protein [Helicobacter baculiformis]